MSEPRGSAKAADGTPLRAAERWLRTDRILLFVGLALLLWTIGHVLLLVFAAILFAVGLDGAARGVGRWTRLPRGWSLALVLTLVGLSIGLLGRYVVPHFFAQLDDLWQTLVGALQGLQDLYERAGYRHVLEAVDMEPNQAQMVDMAQMVAAHLASMTTGVFGAMGSLIVLLAIMLFAAADPMLYRGGVLRLFPPKQRPRLNEVLGAVADALRWWFLGQIVSMIFLGSTVAVGLMLIGLDLWLSLALLAGLLTFIPFLGPLIAAVPIVVVGFAEGMQTGLIVLVFFVVVQNIEGSFLVPMIQHRAVDLAPALLISVQVLAGTLFGALGLVLAAPLTVVAMVIVKRLYIEDVLEKGRREGPPA